MRPNRTSARLGGRCTVPQPFDITGRATSLLKNSFRRSQPTRVRSRRTATPSLNYDHQKQPSKPPWRRANPRYDARCHAGGESNERRQAGSVGAVLRRDHQDSRGRTARGAQFWRQVLVLDRKKDPARPPVSSTHKVLIPLTSPLSKMSCSSFSRISSQAVFNPQLIGRSGSPLPAYS